ncbi:Hsp20/alpha crystallin family protein [Haloquadratum walsbyi]|jgi:HSP20 family protein|uniref:Hsp20-type molecular chaperone n=1 Tax=Haloquadratum walsbyi (strain DSM 16854 / JCM 12705 / C23) TaxID=768065 RepID=G0LIE2_HALWC|nr:Hsp20/alpha crystallin family protein [Haloquadratum walsbyi]CCC39862.1 Hsp20-type molecular chaperone [Haloquadratum walsbyi C23]
MTKRQNPFRELERLFEQMHKNVEEAATQLTAESSTGITPTGTIRVDLEDRETAFVVTAELPGFNREDIDVQLTNQILQIRANQESEMGSNSDSGYIRQERYHASVSRSIRLPKSVDPNEVTAKYNNGILSIEMAKKDPNTNETQIEIE